MQTSVQDTHIVPDPELTWNQFVHDVNQLIRTINDGIIRLDVGYESVLGFNEHLNELLQGAWDMTPLVFDAEVRMPPTRLRVVDPEAALIADQIMPLLFCERIIGRFDELEYESDTQPTSNMYIFILDKIAEAMHAEAIEREFCSEYDVIFERTVQQMHYKPAGRIKDVHRRIGIRLTLSLDPVSSLNERTINNELREMRDPHILRDLMQSAEVSVEIHEWDVETWTS